MEIEEALANHLGSNAGVRNLCAGRVFPNVVPQGQEGLSLAFQRISGPRDKSHDGATRLSWPRFQLTMQGPTYGEVKELGAAVRSALRNYTGTMGGTGGVAVGAVFLEDDVDDFVEESRTHVTRLDIIIWHTEQ